MVSIRLQLRLDDYWITLESALPEFRAEQQHTAVALYRELAKGKPLILDRVAGVLSMLSGEGSTKLAPALLRAFIYAHKGLIADFGGLATARDAIMSSG